MKLKGLVLGEVGKIVRNGNTLKAMAKRGHFEYPIDQVECMNLMAKQRFHGM